jgi:DNA-binding transcriptional regulator YbjK
VQNVAADQKQFAADRVEAYGSAIHESARSLEQQDPNIAWLTHQAADRLEGIANYMRSRDFQGLRKDAENLARRHPGAFFGGMCVAGLVLGNVIRTVQSSSTESHADNGDPVEPDLGGSDTNASFGTAQDQRNAAAAEI